MKKNKKAKTDTKTKGKSARKKTVLKSLRKLGKRTGLSRLSTTQKVVGGAALVALGVGYLAKRNNGFPDLSSSDVTDSDATAAEQNLNSLDGGNV